MKGYSYIEKLHCALGLKRKIVGVKFIFTKHEFENIEIEQLQGAASYCHMVKMASEGRRFKAGNENFLCYSSAWALGMRQPNEKAVAGREYFLYGLYDSLSRAKQVQSDVTYINHKICGIAIMPIEEFDCSPDVVIIMVDSYQAMRLVQGYTYGNGFAKNMRLCGNQGVCSECTAVPYENNDINISMLCANTRFACEWEDCEMGVGMPFNLFESVAKGVIATLNPVEPDYKKEEIARRSSVSNLHIEIEIGKNYYI